MGLPYAQSSGRVEPHLFDQGRKSSKNISYHISTPVHLRGAQSHSKFARRPSPLARPPLPSLLPPRRSSALSIYEVYDESANTLDPSSVRLGKSLVNAFMIVLVLAGEVWSSFGVLGHSCCFFLHMLWCFMAWFRCQVGTTSQLIVMTFGWSENS